MRKYRFYFFIGALTSLLACACSDDDWKDDVSALKKPVPGGVVFVDSASVTAVKGTEFKLRFRVNPTGAEVSKEALELDIRNSDTYLRYDPSTEIPDAAQSRASYVTPSDYYEIVSVEADTNQGGEPLEGQWVATVATRGEGNFRNTADLYLIVNYTDAAGVTRKVSSAAFPVEILPTADEGLEFRYSRVQNFRTAEGKFNPYILQIDVNAYRNAAGKVWYYDRRFVTPSAGIEGGALTADFSTLLDKYYLSFTPVEKNALWAALEAGQAETAATKVSVTLTDIGGTEKRLELPVTYCPHKIVLRHEVPVAELNAHRDDIDYYIDLSADAARYGLTAEMASQLTRIGVMPVFDTDLTGDFGISEVETEGEGHTFVLHAFPFVPAELTSGFTMGDDDARLTYSLTSFPQGANPTENVQVLLNVDICIVIEGVQ